MSGVLLKAATALGAALAPLLEAIAAIAALGAIFDEIATYAEGGETAFQGLWEAIGTPEDFKAVGKAVQDFASDVWKTISGLAKDVGWVYKKVKKCVDDLLYAIAGLFNPGTPGSEWSALRTIIDGIKSSIDLMIGAVKDLLAWVEKVIRGIRSWWNSGANEQAVSAVTGGKPKEQYIAEQAAEIKKANPRLTDEEATKSAERQLSFNAALKRDYDTFNGNRLSLESMGYHEEDIDAFEKAMSNTAATITSRAPDAAQIRQDNSRKTTVNVKNDTVVNNRFEGVTDGNAAGLMNDAANSTQRAVERGNNFALGNGTAAFNSGVFGS